MSDELDIGAIRKEMSDRMSMPVAPIIEKMKPKEGELIIVKTPNLFIKAMYFDEADPGTEYRIMVVAEGKSEEYFLPHRDEGFGGFDAIRDSMQESFIGANLYASYMVDGFILYAIDSGRQQ